MGKFADRYFLVDPWKIIEKDFNPAYSEVSESIFSLGNEFMGVRGYFEEGYSGKSLQGSYINGIFEKRPLQKSGYKGMLTSTEFMVNAVDWLGMSILANGTKLDLHTAKIKDFERTLDLKTGFLTREFVWMIDDATEVKLSFERFLSMTDDHFGGQRLHLQVVKGQADFTIDASIDFSKDHQSLEGNWWTVSESGSNGETEWIVGQTKTTGQTLRVLSQIEVTESLLRQGQTTEDKRITVTYAGHLNQGETSLFTKRVYVDCAKSQDEKLIEISAAKTKLEAKNYEALKAASADWWANQWLISDIKIQGDDLNQQGIRYCIFQLHQTLHTADQSAIIGAKGLTGEAYNGNTFWDTEVYCLPFYLFNNPKAAKNILQFRYDSLDKALSRAKALDLDGAFYPIATISGDECCDLWQHASLQLQASTGVMYGLSLYDQLIGDGDFIFEKGLPILVEVCRMLATRGDYSGKTGLYGYYGVMGPDEFQMMVNHNCYTNYMAKKSFAYTLDVLNRLKAQDSRAFDAFKQALHLTDEECADWQDKHDKMYIPFDSNTKIFEQHDGFFDLPHLDIQSIPVEDFPLYHHWSYERIYRNDMLKQPDVLMFMLMYNQEFTREEIGANFDYYEPRCIHESSLSPSVHSILAAQLGRDEVAYDFFGFATRMDLDNYNRNTREGLHTTSIAGAWLNIVYGFGGLRNKGSEIFLAPSIPATWEGYAFSLTIEGKVLHIEITKEDVSLYTESGSLTLNLYDEKITVGDKALTFKLQHQEQI